eukprot:8418810-Pyramimonas_sp.AAC.1
MDDERERTDEQRYNAMQFCDLQQARTDLMGIVKELRRAPKRRATPAWSMPSELWLLILDTEQWTKFHKGGLGSDMTPATATGFFE